MTSKISQIGGIGFDSQMAVMKTRQVLVVSGIILITALATIASTTVEAKQARTHQVRISYVPPKNPTHQQAYEILKERQSLEQLQEFLSPFRLPTTLQVTLTECDGEADAMYEYDEITICYEYIEDLRQFMPAKTTPSGIEPIGESHEVFRHQLRR